MKLDSRRITWAVTVVLAVVLAVYIVNLTDLPKSWKVSGAISDICASQNLGEARSTLEMVNDRQMVLDKIKEALDGDGSVVCKTNLLQTLSPHAFNQPRVIRRALDADSLTTRRAACAMLYGVPDLKKRCGEIALEWLKDEGASERHRAALICGQLRLEAARPLLMAAIDVDPETQSELLLLQQSLGALRNLGAEGLADRLMPLLTKEGVNDSVRGYALETLERLDDTPREAFAKAAIGILTNRATDSVLRSKAALALRSTKTEEVVDALEKVLLDKTEADPTLQRNCLWALKETAPLDRLRRLVLDERVYNHEFYGIRIDCCTAYAALNMRERLVLDVLTDYLLDSDPDDRQRTVRIESWLSLWVLTGIAYGPEKRELFQPGRRPKPIPDPDKARDYIFGRRAFLRPGISREQVEAIEQMVKDDTRMQQVRQKYGDFKPQVLSQWKAEAEEAAKKQQEKKEQAKDQEPRDVGPVRPENPENGGGR